MDRRYILILLGISIMVSLLPYMVPMVEYENDEVIITNVGDHSPMGTYYPLYEYGLSYDRILVRDVQRSETVLEVIGTSIWRMSFTPDDKYLVTTSGRSLSIYNIESAQKYSISIDSYIETRPFANSTHMSVITESFRLLTWNYETIDNVVLVQNQSLPIIQNSGNYEFTFSRTGRYLLYNLEYVRYMVIDLTTLEITGNDRFPGTETMIWLPSDELLAITENGLYIYLPILINVRKVELGNIWKRIGNVNERIQSWSYSNDELVFAMIDNTITGIFRTSIVQYHEEKLEEIATVYKHVDNFMWDKDRGLVIYHIDEYESVSNTIMRANISVLQYSSTYSSFAGLIHAGLLFVFLFTQDRGGSIFSKGDLSYLKQIKSSEFDTKSFSQLLRLWFSQNIALIAFTVAAGFDALRGFPSGSVILQFDNIWYYLFVSILTSFDLFVISALVVTIISAKRGKFPNRREWEKSFIAGLLWLGLSTWRYTMSSIYLSEIADEITLGVLQITVTVLLFPVLISYLIDELKKFQGNSPAYELIKRNYIVVLLISNGIFIICLFISILNKIELILGLALFIKGIVIPVVTISLINRIRNEITSMS